jgi:hypothetical protein
MDFPYKQAADGRWKAGDTTGTIANSSQGAGMLAQGLKQGTIKLPTATSEGACRGISIWWLIKRSLGDDFWPWFGPPISAAPTSPNKNGAAGEPVRVIKEVMQQQAKSIGINSSFMTTDQLRTMNLRNAMNYILKHTEGHLITQRGLIEKTAIKWELVENEVKASPGYSYIGFNVDGWGGHAVAVHVAENGDIEFMDPNLGEMDSKKQDFALLMDMVIAPSYPPTLSWFGMQTLAPIKK